jgi:hypothetical protein
MEKRRNRGRGERRNETKELRNEGTSEVRKIKLKGVYTSFHEVLWPVL